MMTTVCCLLVSCIILGWLSVIHRGCIPASALISAAPHLINDQTLKAIATVSPFSTCRLIYIIASYMVIKSKQIRIINKY